jgi:hypothetical protein
MEISPIRSSDMQLIYCENIKKKNENPNQHQKINNPGFLNLCSNIPRH